ncbi:MAG: alpha/beta fold hydrolase [Gemmobacter sp.]
MIRRTLRLSEGLAVRLAEAGEGAPLVLLHGVGLRAEAWGPQIGALAGAHRVIAPDLPGHGESDPLPGNPRLREFVAWAGRLVAALGLGPVSVAGHSMGALIAAGLAIEQPWQVRRVAVLSAVHRRSPEARAAVLARAEAIAAGRGEPEAPLARWFGPGEEAIRAQVAAWLAQARPDGYAVAYRAFAEGDAVYADRIGEIRCPLLVLTGEGDANSTPEMTRAMAAMAPRGQAVVVPAHRHMVGLTAPEAVNAALRQWLETEAVAA